MTAGTRYVRGRRPPPLARHRPTVTRDANGLTEVDRDTLARLAAGGDASSMAAALGIPQHAAARRLARLREVLVAATNAEALDVALERGLVAPPVMPGPADGGGA